MKLMRQKSGTTIIIGIFQLLFFLTGFSYAQSFPVGHMSINFKDSARTGGFAISGGINVTGSGRDVGAEVYYPSTITGDNNPVASGQFPVVIFGHGFVMGWDSYDNIYDQLASAGYIVLLPRTEGSFSPSHSEFGEDLKFLVNAAQSLNSISTPTVLATFNGKVLSQTAIGGHSMGGGSSFLASANNSSITCMFNFAAATTNPSSITSASSVSVPALLISGAIDCVADTTVQNSHYAALSSAIKYHVILKQLTHCDFGDGANFNCTFGQNSSGCSNVVNNAQALPRYMNYLQNFLDKLLKNDCAAGQRFMDSVNMASSLREGLKKMGSIACTGATEQFGNSNEIVIYPNPATSNISIELPINDFKLKLFDVYGKVLFSQDYNNKGLINIGMEELIPGMYILEIESLTESHKFKIIKD